MVAAAVYMKLVARWRRWPMRWWRRHSTLVEEALARSLGGRYKLTFLKGEKRV
jgi:hypothetical protein